MKKISSSGIFAISLFVIWEIIGRMIGLSFILPWPTLIIKRFWELKETLLLHHLIATLYISGISLLISFVLGFILGIAMDRSKKVEECLYPILVSSQTVPITTLSPIFILWFGYGIWSKVLVAVIITFFSITINIHEGLKSVNEDYINLFKSMGASEKEIFFKLKLPSIMPYIFASLKMSIPFVIVGTTIGEWLGGNRGLGYFSKRMMTQLDGAGVFAPIVLISVVAMILVKIISILENKNLKWRGK